MTELIELTFHEDLVLNAIGGRRTRTFATPRQPERVGFHKIIPESPGSLALHLGSCSWVDDDDAERTTVITECGRLCRTGHSRPKRADVNVSLYKSRKASPVAVYRILVCSRGLCGTVHKD